MIESLVSQRIATKDAIQILLNAAFSSGKSFALWRKPKSKVLELVLDSEEVTRKVGMGIEELPAGFIVHPFEDQENKQAFFIKACSYFSLNLNQEVQEIDFPEWVKVNPDPNPKISDFFNRKNIHSFSNKEKQNLGESKSHFIELVEKSIQSIKAGYLEKVVPARTKTITISENFDLVQSIWELLFSYPNSFVNFFHIPEIGTWLGASPEILIETKGDEFYTMSLAGTQKAQGDNPLKSAAWTQKEIEEQALVSRYIVDCFKKIRLREYEEHGPKTVMAGDLLHLRSDFRVNMKETNFPQLGSVMLDLLHPTSAVCGMPRKEAHDFLKDHEDFDRSFFAGFLGPVNVQGSTSIYVNLRTASFGENEITLYAGAGVTEDSDPEKEWEETELKCRIIGKFFQPQLS
ncbi:chorismate-binding protein [Algoriphagus hitonicola]|uniref:isochorismate synthase n=1 Tax=Algoriphagus hitonicola TaxID=435880 RepID=A0A1I2PEA0_9BACT|nr:chorismate-binding protein [Algoriphagus hitonicola]SFG13429.1 isochorismate synthase [Algoriphagus hitonicola]